MSVIRRYQLYLIFLAIVSLSHHAFQLPDLLSGLPSLFSLFSNINMNVALK